MKHQIKIVISLTFAFLIVSLYGRLSSTPFISSIQAENIKGLLANIKFPKFNLTKLFTLQYNPDNNPINNSNLNKNYINLSPQQIQPTSQPTPTEITENQFIEEPENEVPIQTHPTFTPTKVPTSTPKPTKPPKPTPTPAPPAITTSQRPGSTLKEIYQLVQERMCVPAALLYAVQQTESGAWWPANTDSSKVKIYNKYGWWLDGSGSSCTGMGYHVQTGIVPIDAVDAGTKCQNPIPSGANQEIMGLWQISKYEEEAAKKYLTKIIKGNIDRRVIFDSAVIFAVITKNRLGNPPKDCANWPTDAIKTAAEKHYRSCGDNYCDKVLKYYKEYKY